MLAQKAIDDLENDELLNQKTFLTDAIYEQEDLA